MEGRSCDIYETRVLYYIEESLFYYDSNLIVRTGHLNLEIMCSSIT